MAAPEIPRAAVRCPYCVDSADYLTMIEISNSRHVCRKCGHIVSTSDSSFVCDCVKCLQLSANYPKPNRSFR